METIFFYLSGITGFLILLYLGYILISYIMMKKDYLREIDNRLLFSDISTELTMDELYTIRRNAALYLYPEKYSLVTGDYSLYGINTVAQACTYITYGLVFITGCMFYAHHTIIGSFGLLLTILKLYLSLSSFFYVGKNEEEVLKLYCKKAKVPYDRSFLSTIEKGQCLGASWLVEGRE